MDLLDGVVTIFFSVVLGIFFVSRYLMNRRRAAPTKWPFLGMLPGFLTNINRVHDYVTAFLREVGGNFEYKGPWLCGKDCLITSDPANTNHILNLHFHNYVKGQSFNEIFEDMLGEGILNVDGESWKRQRKMALSLMGSLKFRESVTSGALERVDKVLIPLLSNMAERGKPFDLYDVFMRFTLDSTCTLLFGVDPGSLNLHFPIIPFVKAVEEAEHVLLFRHAFPRIWWRVLRRLRVGPERTLAAASQVIDSFIAHVITEKRKKINLGVIANDMLTSYMNGSVMNPTTTMDKFLRDTVLTFLLAGKDTTAVALSWLLWLVSNNPHVEERILAELKEVAGEHLTTEGVGKLLYLHAAACEALRLYPSLPFNRKEALQPDVLPSGHKIKKGGMVGISIYAMGRMESV